MALNASDLLRRYKRFLKSFLQLVKKTKSPMSVPLVHTLFVATASILLCLGIGLPNWVAFTHIYEHCNNEGYSGLWVACSKHCTVNGAKWIEYENSLKNKSATAKDPFDVPKENCTEADEVEACYNFEENLLVEKGPLQATRFIACASAFLSFVALGFAIVRWLKWGQIDTPNFNLIMVLLSTLSGLAGVAASVLMPVASVNSDEVTKQSKKVSFIQHGLIMFGVGSIVNILDGMFMVVKGNTPDPLATDPVESKKEDADPEVAADEAEAPPEADEPAAA